jgi:hypothetical protein
VKQAEEIIIQPTQPLTANYLGSSISFDRAETQART